MYNPGQLRGPDGRWISTGARKVSRAKRSAANKAAYAGRHAKRRSAPIRIDKAASRQARGVGLTGLKQNLIPHARISKRGITVGVNTGSFIPGTNKRVVVGQYVRFESVNKETKLDKAAKAVLSRIAPKGSRRDILGQHVRKNAKFSNPAIRYQSPGSSSRNGIEARLGTSRKSGPTVVIRRGEHKRTRAQSKAGIAKYNKAVNKGQKASKPRPTRRRQAARKRSRR